MIVRIDIFRLIDEELGAEVGIAFCRKKGRHFFGDKLLTRVQFHHAPRAPLSVYEGFFNAPVIFETDYNGLVISQEVLKRRNQKNDVESAVLLRGRLDELRRDMGIADDDGLADVREAILRNAKRGDYTVTGLASAMAMSPRNLRSSKQKRRQTTPCRHYQHSYKQCFKRHSRFRDHHGQRVRLQ